MRERKQLEINRRTNQGLNTEQVNTTGQQISDGTGTEAHQKLNKNKLGECRTKLHKETGRGERERIPYRFT